MHEEYCCCDRPDLISFNLVGRRHRAFGGTTKHHCACFLATSVADKQKIHWGPFRPLVDVGSGDIMRILYRRVRQGALAHVHAYIATTPPQLYLVILFAIIHAVPLQKYNQSHIQLSFSQLSSCHSGSSKAFQSRHQRLFIGHPSVQFSWR